MKQYLKIDENGFYIEPVILEETEEDVVLDNFIEETFPSGLYKPKWDGTTWTEGITEEELEEIKEEALRQAQLEPPSYEEISQKAVQLEKVVNELIKTFITSDSLTEEQKELITSQYRTVDVGDTVYPDEVVNIDGKLFKMVQPSAITIHDISWLSDKSLFAPFLQYETDDGVPVVHEYVQPTGSHDAYHKGDKVLFNGKVYQAVMDNVTWSPADYPPAWELKE